MSATCRLVFALYLTENAPIRVDHLLRSFLPLASHSDDFCDIVLSS